LTSVILTAYTQFNKTKAVDSCLAHMKNDSIKPNCIVRGSIFPEPEQVILVTPVGNSIKLIGVGDPQIDIGNVETVTETLYDTCYYLEARGNQYRFTLKENLNKRFADKSASVKDPQIEEMVKEEIQETFVSVQGIERIFFPENSALIPDRPVITLVIMGPEYSIKKDPGIRQMLELMTREHGQSSRTYKSALIWVVPESIAQLRQEARKLIAWQDIEDERLQLDEAQQHQLSASIKKAQRDLKETVWRTYKNVMLLGKDGALRLIDLGMPTSSASDSMSQYILTVLYSTNDIEKGSPSPRFLVKNWPPAFIEWDTKSVRDAFFASPLFPCLLDSAAVKETIARGVTEALIAYVGKAADGSYSPFVYKNPLGEADVIISEDMFIIRAEEAEKHIQPPVLSHLSVTPSQAQLKPGTRQTYLAKGADQHGRDIDASDIQWTATGGMIGEDGVYIAGENEGNFIVTAKAGGISGIATVNIVTQPELKPPEPPKPQGKPKKLTWTGEVVPQKWMNLYTRVLTKFVQSGNLKLKVSIEVTPPDGVTNQQVEETKAALKELGMNDEVKTE
jgi:hypothetical protein